MLKHARNQNEHFDENFEDGDDHRDGDLVTLSSNMIYLMMFSIMIMMITMTKQVSGCGHSPQSSSHDKIK